ncbi:unnamed protein product [Prorocentrum cordatum]|uniref:Uncharacterized protein n=1 Tax=Prorocentrum cordatum TaxID=2364126 RepID=A0ABN9VBT8_9DINO|nr:unnamed protein product [Polarella glacialis]
MSWIDVPDPPQEQAAEIKCHGQWPSDADFLVGAGYASCGQHTESSFLRRVAWAYVVFQPFSLASPTPKLDLAKQSAGDGAAAAGGALDAPGARWEYVLKDEARRCFAGHLRAPLSRQRRAEFFQAARDGTAWARPRDMPRATAWMVARQGRTCTI